MSPRRLNSLALLSAIACVLCWTAEAAVSRVTIDLPDALGVEFGSAAQRMARLELFLEGREIQAVLVSPIARNPALASWDARNVNSTLAWKGNALEGIIEARIHPAGPGNPTPWRCTVDATWRDGALVGRASCAAANTSLSGGGFSAAPTKLDAARSDSGFIEIVLPGAGDAAGVRAGIEFQRGRATAAASFSPRIHPVWQRLDASGLALKSGKLSGKLIWLAASETEDAPTAGAREISLSVDLRSGFAPILRGKGAPAGAALLTPDAVFPENAELELAIDAPLLGGERWRRRAVVRLDLSKNTARPRAFFNGRADPDWSGLLDAAALTRKGGHIEGRVEATVASAVVQPGLYRISFKGELVGPWIVGTFVSTVGATDASAGDFTGWFTPSGG